MTAVSKRRSWVRRVKLKFNRSPEDSEEMVAEKPGRTWVCPDRKILEYLYFTVEPQELLYLTLAETSFSSSKELWY